MTRYLDLIPLALAAIALVVAIRAHRRVRYLEAHLVAIDEDLALLWAKARDAD